MVLFTRISSSWDSSHRVGNEMRNGNGVGTREQLDHIGLQMLQSAESFAVDETYEYL